MFIAGLTMPSRGEDTSQFLIDAQSDLYDFVTTNLPHSAFSGSNARSDITTLESKFWSTSTVGLVTDPIQYEVIEMNDDENGPRVNYGERLIEKLSLPPDNPLKRHAEETLSFMLDWASHMSIPAIILPPVPTHSDKGSRAAYARFLASKCLGSNLQFWVRVPCDKQSVEAFALLHKMSGGMANLGCMLMFANSASPTDVAPTSSKESESIGKNLVLLHQLIGCNLRAICFETSVFLTNKRGYPTLSKSSQLLFTVLLQRLGQTIRVLVEGAPMHQFNSADISSPNTGSSGKTGCSAYLQYLRHLRGRKEVASILDTEESDIEFNYLDSLQSALQPLGDNLEFCTYETFERDPVKYERYRRAVELALQDKISKGHLDEDRVNSITNAESSMLQHQNSEQDTSSGSNEFICRVEILVVGAGRGPLVQACLEAVLNVNEANQRKNEGGYNSPMVICRVIALEKNPSAVLFLNSRKGVDPLWNVVDVIECDMRYAQSALKGFEADLVVSELLGSFGDNELSPECLDGLQRCGVMKRTCISIPQRYVSFLAPVSSMRLHAEAQAQAYSPSNASEGPAGKPCGALQAMETPYVVRTHAASQTHLELSCWDFSHPLTDRSSNACTKEAAIAVDNERHKELLFVPDSAHGAGSGSGYGLYDSSVTAISASARNDASIGSERSNTGITIHGFLGTFHCVLYQSITNNETSSIISTAPSSFSTGMFSWFPLYFPLREPLYVPNGASLKCNIWRKTDEVSGGNGCGGGKVWYEWCAEVLGAGVTVQTLNVSPVHNPSGRSSFVRL